MRILSNLWYCTLWYLTCNSTKSILKAPYFKIMFNKSLNSVIKNEQMDIQIRYWSDEDCKVQTKHYDSKFLKRATLIQFLINFYKR